jgi:hypothetical protein
MGHLCFVTSRSAVGERASSPHRILFGLAVLILGSPLFAAEPRFTASLDRDSIILGEGVTLTMRFEGGAPKALPSLPQVPGLQVGQGISTSINTSTGPQGTTSVHSYSLTIVPQQAGEFTIPALTADVGDRALSSEPLKLKVAQSDPATPATNAADRPAFLQLVLPKTQAFLGEALVAELRLYLRGDVQNVTEVQLPPLTTEGFNTSKFIEGQRFQRQIGNAPYNVIPLQVALTPIKTGTFTAGQAKGSLVAHIIVNRQRRDIFDGFFGPPTQARKTELSLEEQKIEVLPLPSENVPPGFAGAVGNFSMTFTAGPTNIAAGDPITVKVRIAGKGHLESLSLPEESAWRDFKIYPPTSQVETSDPLGLQGAKNFEQIVVPQSADVKELPPLSFSYFDPEQKRYRTLTQPAVPLMVRPGGSAPAPTVIAAQNTSQDQAPAQDIVHIKPRLGALAQIDLPLIQRPWFIGLQAVPIIALLTAVAWRKRADMLANNPRLRRQRAVAQLVRQGVHDLRRLAAENNSDQFFATLFRLLQEQLGERLNLPASAITEAVIEERLVPRSVSEKLLSDLQELFQACNFARYAPIKTSQELAAFIPKFESVIRDLESLQI